MFGFVIGACGMVIMFALCAMSLQKDWPEPIDWDNYQPTPADRLEMLYYERSQLDLQIAALERIVLAQPTTENPAVTCDAEQDTQLKDLPF